MKILLKGGHTYMLIFDIFEPWLLYYNEMKGIKDVWNTCIIKCIVSGYLYEIMLIKGVNSRRNEITDN